METLPQKIPISMAFAPTASHHLYLETEVEVGTRIIEALQQSGWLSEYPELAIWCDDHKNVSNVDNRAWRVGIFSAKKPLHYQLQPHDRIEVYRPLTIDPMRKRKKRATQQ